MSFLKTPRSRELGAWLGALLLHVVALGLLRNEVGSGEATHAAPTLPVPTWSEELEIELGDGAPLAPEAPADDGELRRAGSSAPTLAKRATRAHPREPHFEAEGAAGVDESPNLLEALPTTEGDPAEPDADATDATAASPRQPLDLGIGPDAWRTWARAQPPANQNTEEQSARGKRRPLVRSPTPSKTGGLQEGLEVADRKRGLGPSGRVVTALYQATHSEVAPQLGVAHFSVTVLRSGEVQVSLNSANKESEKWRAVAERAAVALRKAPPRIPPSREGVRLTLDVTAEETFPNGAKPTELHGPQLEADLLEFKSTAETQAELEANNPVTATSRVAPSERPPLITKVPGVYVSGRGKVCSYRVGVTLLGPGLQGGCDLSNVGAKPQRMVRVAVQDQSFF
jgi:hypothetical protein